GREDFATISVRGSTPGQVKILLDGVPLNRAGNDVVNLADISLDSVERIEVFRGFTPVRYASSGAASVVNIVTRSSAGPISGSLSWGSFATVKATLAGAAAVAGGTLSVTSDFRETDGDFRFTSESADPTVGGRRRRINNDRRSWNLALRYDRRDRSDSRWSLIGNVLHVEEGTPGRGDVQAARARSRKTRAIASASWQTSRGLRAAADLTYVGETQRDPKSPPDDAGLGFPFERFAGRTWAAAVEVGAWRAAGERHFFETSAEVSLERFEGRFPGITPKRDQERIRAALAAGDEVALAGARLTLAPQVRLELLHNRFDGSGLVPPVDPSMLPDATEVSVDPRLGLRWDAAPSLTLKANAGTYFRPPNFGELFGDDGFSAANPSLDPERGISRDAGLIWRGRGRRWSATAEYAYFDNEVDDMIVFVPSGARVPRPQNVGAASVRGHELRLEAGLGSHVDCRLSYTRQQAEDRSNIRDFRGHDLPSQPRDELYGRVSVSGRRWRLTYEVDAQSRVFLDRAGFQRVPGHATHGLTLALGPWAGGWHVELEADNLGDEQYSDVFGFPVPGRAFYLTLSYARRP
ncbi:MAG: TonB-dependent receptor, partial [Deltaproteobacteria bacterium]